MVMEIFGKLYVKGQYSSGESVKICALDTFCGNYGGTYYFPACFSYGVESIFASDHIHYLAKMYL